MNPILYFLLLIAAFLAAHYVSPIIADAIYRYRAFHRITGYSRVQPVTYKDWWSE